MKGKPFKLVFFGECMVEHRANGTSHYGGDTFNSAWYLANLLADNDQHNIEVSYATATGLERESVLFRALLLDAGIDDRFVLIHPSKTLGQYWVSLDEQGERHFRFDRNHSPVRSYFFQDELLTQALIHKNIDAIYISGISLAILCERQRAQLLNALRVFKQQGGQVYFDNNYRPALWTSSSPQPCYQAVMGLADIAFLTNEDEYAVFASSNVDEIICLHREVHHSRAILVIRQGAEPCVIQADRHAEPLSIAAERLASSSVVDTCAAGDAFAAGFLAKWLTQHPLTEAARFAHKVAARVIQHQGALISPLFLPSLSSKEFVDDSACR